MDQQYSETECQGPGFSPKVQINVSDVVQKYRYLESAISRGQSELVELLLETDAPVNCHPVCCQLRTPLYSSVNLGNPKIVEKLLSKGANVNVKYSGDTPLTLAAKQERFEIADIILLNARELRNCANHERITHLHIACMRNRVSVAKKLLKCKKDVDTAVDCGSRYWPGFTSLHFAVQFHCLEIVKFLLDIGADITIKDARQFTPLHLAHILRYEEIVDMILLTHDRIIACIRNNLRIAEHFIHLGVNLQDPNSDHRSSFEPKLKTAIDLAIQHECVDVVKLLLQYSTCESCQDEEEFDRIKDAYCTGNMEIVDLLIEENELSRKVKKFDTNYLDLFTRGDNTVIKRLISENPSASNQTITSTGCTVLHSAIEYGNKLVSKVLVDQGADYSIQDIRGKSPLHLAFEHSMNDLADLMLQDHKRFLKNVVDNDGLSYLHIACARNDVEAVKSLLELGADVNSPVSSTATFWAGYTPLHFAAKFGSEKVAYVLLKRHANYSATDAFNLSAFDVAFMEVNKNSNVGACDCLKLILISHSKRKDEGFNDRGVTLVHLASLKVGSHSTRLGELGQLLDTHVGDVNKAIHRMNSSWDGCTPLHLAVKNNDTCDHAKLLMRMGADVLAQDLNGDTPMHLAVSSLIIPDTIFDLRDSRFLQLNHIGTKGLSIFHVACTQGNLKLMKYYLENGVDANYQSLNVGLGCADQAPLHLVVRSSIEARKIDAVKLLLDYGVDPNVRDLQGNTPLHFMKCCFSHPEIISLLVSHGADVDARNVFLDTPLIRLVCDVENGFYMCSDVVRLVASFMSNGANIDLANKRGATVFSVALSWGSLDPSDEPDFQDIIDVVDILLRQTFELEILGIFMSERNRDFCSLLLSAFSDHLSFEKNILTQACLNELELLKHIRIDYCTTFYDILLRSPNKLAVISQNSAFRNLVDSNDFCEKYPVYGPMLKLRLQQGQRRLRLLNDSAKPLSLLLGIALPQLCSDIILRCLDDQDLRNIIVSK